MIPPPPPSADADEPTRCWAEIDLAALRHNVAVAREAAGAGADVLAVVKADAYGHGLAPVARELFAACGVRRFGVANVREAAVLQTVLPPGDVEITLLSPALPHERAEVVRRGLLPWVSSLAEVEDYARLARSRADGAPVEIEINVDTGMGRDGVLAADYDALRRAVAALPGVRVQGIATHLPSPDEDEAYTVAQLAGFEQLLSSPLPVPADTADAATSPLPGRRHAQNSAGLLGYPLAAGCNLVRPGLMLYGSSPLPSLQARLRPVLTLRTSLSLVRELPAGHGVSYGRTFVTPRPMRVGTLAAGYGDGYPRRLSHTGAAVLVRGRRCPVLGRVTMDQTMIDLSGLPADVDAGEEAVLLGRQGEEEIPAAELATRAGTIAWEIFTGLTARVGRRYVRQRAEG